VSGRWGNRIRKKARAGWNRCDGARDASGFRQKMDTPEAQKQYRRRSRVIEFCHAWIKSKLGLRQFHLRGLAKAQMEMLWACLTYNLQQWIRLRKLQVASAAG
jgi:Transposase DDE domain